MTSSAQMLDGLGQRHAFTHRGLDDREKLFKRHINRNRGEMDGRVLRKRIGRRQRRRGDGELRPAGAGFRVVAKDADEFRPAARRAARDSVRLLVSGVRSSHENTKTRKPKSNSGFVVS